MPKKPSSKRSRPQCLASTSSITTGPIELSATAQALFDRVSADWSLSPPVKALLRLIAENMTRAELCDEILGREGLVVPDAKGASKVHPLALLARDHRNAASNGLQRLLSNIEG
jgi:hypothetical protein